MTEREVADRCKIGCAWFGLQEGKGNICERVTDVEVQTRYPHCGRHIASIGGFSWLRCALPERSDLVVDILPAQNRLPVYLSRDELQGRAGITGSASAADYLAMSPDSVLSFGQEPRGLLTVEGTNSTCHRSIMQSR